MNARREERQRTQDPGQAGTFARSLVWVCVALIVCVLTATGCSTFQKVPLTPAWRQARVRNEGYSLLYQLLSQESDVAKILIIKHADPKVTDIIREIASASDEAKKALEQFRKEDHYLNFEMTNLPQIEQKTRSAIESTETKQLLFSSGKTFEDRLLFTQAQAMNYAAHLAKVLRDQEANPGRKDYLAKLSERCTTLHDKVIDLMK